MEYIDPDINENDRKLRKHETRNILFVSISFQAQRLMLSTSSLNCLSAFLHPGSHFLYRDLLVFLGPLNSCPIIPILRCENTSNATGNSFALKTSQ